MRRSAADESGITSIQFLLASALALWLFVLLANLVVVQYGRGAIQSALEQGARAGSLSGEVADCVAKAGDVSGQLLGGRMSDGLEVRCEPSGDGMVATATARFDSWTPVTPSFDVSLRAQAVIEELP